MLELTRPKLIYLKGFLFLVTGTMATAILIIDQPTTRTALLLAITIWSFARFYYFAFYVMEKYVDPTRRFAGLWSLMREALGGRGSCRAASPARQEPRPPMCKKR